VTAKIVTMTGELVNGDLLDKQINDEHAAVVSSVTDAVRHALKCGELLEKRKAKTAHGEWRAWLDKNFSGGKSTAHNYMKLAANVQFVGHLISENPGIGLTEVYKALPKPERKKRAKTETKKRAKTETKKTEVKRQGWNAGVAARIDAPDCTSNFAKWLSDHRDDIAAYLTERNVDFELGKKQLNLPELNTLAEHVDAWMFEAGFKELETLKKAEEDAKRKLAPTAKETMERATRAAEKRIRRELEKEFAQKSRNVNADARKLMGELNARDIELMKLRKKLLPISTAEFKTIRSVLHPDRVANEERKASAFTAFNKLAVFFNS